MTRNNLAFEDRHDYSDISLLRKDAPGPERGPDRENRPLREPPASSFVGDEDRFVLAGDPNSHRPTPERSGTDPVVERLDRLYRSLAGNEAMEAEIIPELDLSSSTAEKVAAREYDW